MIRRLVRQMLISQTLSALTISLCLLIDSIMIGRFLGVDAVAAYGLANPILLIVGAIGSLLAAGVQVVCSRSLGSGSMEETNQGYSSSIALALCSSVALMVLVLLFRNPLAVLMGATGEKQHLFDLTREYMAGFIIGAPATMGALILVPFLQMAGQNNLLIVAVLAMTVSDIVFDILSVFVFNGGMFGMGLASSLSYYVAMAVAMIYFLSKDCVFKFSRKHVTMAKIRELIKGGIPTIFNMASTVVCVFVINRILLLVSGSDAVAAFTTIMTIGNSANCISTGVGGVSLTLSGILFNEEDKTGLKDMLTYLSRCAVVMGVAMGAVIVLIAPFAVKLFINKPGETRDMPALGVRLFALGLVPCCLNNALKSFYQGTERVRLTELISVIEGAAFPILVAFVFSRFMGVTGVWLYFALGELLALICVALWAIRQKRHLPMVQRFMLLKDEFGVRSENLMEDQIRSLEDVARVAKEAGDFCRSHGYDEKTVNHIQLCIEEKASNTVTYGFEPGKDNCLSVRIQNKGDKWVLRFRDDCGAFDPVRYVPGPDRTDAVGIRLMIAMADDIRYTYSLNLNNLTIKLSTEGREAKKE